jgi:uncharacterized protein (TIGR02300 family)
MGAAQQRIGKRRGTCIVAKAELGTKRVCPNCGTKYYDLNKTPPFCPKCGTEFVVITAKTRPQGATPKKEEPKEEAEEATPAVETISLEEADEEAVGGKSDKDEETADLEAADSTNGDTFVEEDQNEDDDVAEIVGGVEGEDD